MKCGRGDSTVRAGDPSPFGNGRLRRDLARHDDAVRGTSLIVAGCDCGFETVMTANLVSLDFVWEKLAALDDGVRLAEGRLSCDYRSGFRDASSGMATDV